MRMVRVKQESMCLEDAAKKFLLIKEAQCTGTAAMQDYKYCLRRFVANSHNSLDYDLLEEDTLTFFSAIPDTSPARYNKPYQNINAFFRWLTEKELVTKNPIKELGLHKRKDDGNIKPISVSDLRQFLRSLDRQTFTGLRDYTIIMVMLDTGIRTKELLGLQYKDYSPIDKSLTIEKTLAKTKKKRIAYLSNNTTKALEYFLSQKPKDWEDWLFPNYEGHQLKVSHLDKSFAKHSNACGIKITPYQLRHSFATLFLKSGGDLFSLQHLMGHADLRMTKRYTQLDEDYIIQQHKSFSPIGLLTKENTKRLRKIY